jgi:hypothetical protein
MTDLCKHNLAVCSRCVVVTDAAKRMADTINSTVAFKHWDELVNGWMAFQLADGSSDGTVYQSQEEAAKFQKNPEWAVYWCFRQGMAGVTAHDCQIFLNLHRHVYDNGGRFTPRDVRRSPNLILSTRGYDFMSGRRIK